LHAFDEISDVLGGLQKLMDREPALAAILPRQPGTKESRYAHLLSGTVESAVAAENAAGSAYARREPVQYAARAANDDPAHEGRIAQLEAAMAELQQKMDALNKKIDDLFGDG
jgi:uncharacterized protein YceH (UPF0502 family)